MGKPEEIQLNDGDVLTFKIGDWFNFTCCDCGLTHKIQTGAIEEENRITLKFTRVNRITTLERQTLGGVKVIIESVKGNKE